MPGSFREVSNAEEEGVIFEWLAAPRAMQGDASGVSGVRAARMRLGPPDASGRQIARGGSGRRFRPTGADGDQGAWVLIRRICRAQWRAPDLAVSRWGTVRADLRTMMTSQEGVFAAGDIVRGASLVVWAIRDGVDAAAAIDRYLDAKAQPLMAAE